MYLNKAIIAGNLTRDPELKALPSGSHVTNFSVATNRVWLKDGAKQEETEFHNVVVFGRQAETSAKYLKKGQSVLVEGRIQTRSWEKDGVKRYSTEIIAESVQFGSKAGGEKETPKDDFEGPHGSRAQDEYPEDEINPADIPFS